MTESPCSAFEAFSRSPSFLTCLLIYLCLLYLYRFSVCFFSMPCLVFVFLLVITLLSSFTLILTPSFCYFPCLSASCYCNHLFTQPVAHFLPSPVSYSLNLSDFITLMQEKPLLFSFPTIATNSDHVFLFVSELWWVHGTCVCLCTWASIT